MITGAHVVLFSVDPDVDRAFLRTVLDWPSVHASGPDDPWLIFRLPPAEVGVHPTEGPSDLSLYLLCDDLSTTMAELAGRGVEFSTEPQQQGWGTVVAFSLPSGAEVGLYEPRHRTARDG